VVRVIVYLEPQEVRRSLVWVGEVVQHMWRQACLQVAVGVVNISEDVIRLEDRRLCL
jgi:hypothetical protein